MRRAFQAAALAAAASLALAACSTGGSGASETPADGAEASPLHVGNFLDITNWDPALADIGFDGPYLSAIYDPLLTVDAEGEPQPGIATAWDVSDDFLTVTFDLRTDAEFSDGTALDADAAVEALEHLRSGPLWQEAYLKVDSIEAADEDTVVFHMSERDDTMLYLMGLGRSWLASPEAIRAGTLSESPVGSGPFTLSDSSVPGAEYHFERVEGHWNADQFPFSPLSITPLSDANAMLNAMESGQLNLIYTDKTGKDLADQNGWNVTSGLATWAGLQYTDRAGDMGSPIGNVKVRQALNYAFDTVAMHESISQGEGFVTNQVFPVDHAGYVSELDDRYAYDPEKAKSLMAEAGYADGFDLVMPMAPPFQPWQAIVEQTLTELGITVTFEETDFMTYMSKASEYPVAITVTAIDSHPVASVERQIAKEQFYNPNPGLQKYPEIQAQVDAVYAAEPGDEQVRATEKLNELVTEAAFMGVWGQSENIYVSTPEFEVTPIIGMMFPTLDHIALSR